MPMQFWPAYLSASITKDQLTDWLRRRLCQLGCRSEKKHLQDTSQQRGEEVEIGRRQDERWILPSQLNARWHHDLSSCHCDLLAQLYTRLRT
jgi:hypothetical protein